MTKILKLANVYLKVFVKVSKGGISMSKGGIRALGLILGFLFILGGTAWSANIKITINPKTKKPVIKTDVPITSKKVTPEGVVVTLATGERFSYKVTPTGAVSIQVMSGVINAVVSGAVAKISAGEAAAIKINPATNTVQVVAQRGVVEVSSQGRVIKVKPGYQTAFSAGAPPAPPSPAPSKMAAPPSPPAPVAMAPGARPAPPRPPKFQVDPHLDRTLIPPPAPKIKVEEFHGQKPASPAL